MDTVVALINEVLTNWPHYVELANNLLISAAAFLGTLVAVATAIAKITPSPKDDEVVGKFTGLVARLSVIKLKGSK